MQRRDGGKVSKSMAELKRMAEDRKKWKSFTEDPPTLISNQGQLKKKKKKKGVKIDKEDRHENDIKNSINKGRVITAMLKMYCGTDR